MSGICKICFISPMIGNLLLRENGNAGGAERQFWLFGQELRRRGCPVAYITTRPENDGPRTEKAANFDIQFADFSWMNGTKLHLISGFFSLIRAMRRTRADVFIIKTPAILLLPMLTYRFFCGGKMVFWGQTSHDAQRERPGISRFASKIQNWAMPKTNLVIAQTNDQRENFRKNFGMEAVWIPNIYPIIENEDTQPPISCDVFWCGNSSVNKRQEIIFALAKRLPEYRFVIAMNCSSDARFTEARRQAAELPNVTFAGAVSGKEIMRYFRGCRVYVNTSGREGFPNTFMQAWAAGKPVLSLCIDPDDMLKQNSLGICIGKNIDLQQSRDFESLAEQLSGPLTELLRSDLAVYAQKGPAWLRSNCSAVVWAETLYNLLK